MTTLPSIAAPELVTLTGGFTVSIDALRLAWDLEDRQFEIRVVDGVGLTVRPRSRLTSDDDHAIRTHRDELIALTRYCEAIQ